MPVDALVLAATDPDTLLGLGAGVVHGMPPTVCAPFWEYEFEVPDFNKFSDLARAPRATSPTSTPRPAAARSAARAGASSATFMDADAELRATFNAGGRGWGLLHLNRAGTAHGFRDEEVAFVETIAPIVGRALRLSLISHPARSGAGCAPGMAIVDAGNRLVSATPEALDWFDKLETIYRVPDPGLGARRAERGRLIAAAERAARASGATRTRVRTRCGVWLLIHARACTSATGGRRSPS